MTLRFVTSICLILEYNKILLFDNIFTSAQDCSKEENGAFTGEVSASMINSLGSKYTILGHSERREYFSETNIDLKQKGWTSSIFHQMITKKKADA